MRTSWKKSLAVAAILTSLFATSAFAAEQKEAPKPSMRERVNVILQEENNEQTNSGQYIGGRRYHRGDVSEKNDISISNKKMKEREERRAHWRDMSPKEREKMRQHWHDERVMNMTPEERADYDKRNADREKWERMTPEERAKVRAEARAEWDKKTPEEKEKIRNRYRDSYDRHYRNGDRYNDGYCDRGASHYRENGRYRHDNGEYCDYYDQDRNDKRESRRSSNDRYDCC